MKTPNKEDRNDDLHFDCEMCEALLPEAAEGSLLPAEQAALDRHVAECAACAAAMSEAQRGLAWLTMLKAHRPEPADGLLERILAQTTGADAIGREEVLAQPQVVGVSAMPPAPLATGWRGTVRRWWGDWTAPGARGFHGLQPRFAMTTAMAFVSITLTLNLMGVSLRDLHMRDLRPAQARRMAAEAQASVVRQVQGNPVVDQLESRVNDLRELAGFARQQPQQ